MSYTFKDAADFVFRDIRGGASPDSALTKARINQALGLALKEQYSAGAYNAWEVATNPRERELLLPPEIKTAEIIARVAGAQINQVPQWYHFLSDTYALEAARGTCVPLEVEDAGDQHVQETELCEAKLILALVEKPHGAPNAEHEGVIHLQGIGGDDRPVWDLEGRPGFTLRLSDTRPSYSDLAHMSVKVKRLTAVQKPKTRWPVVLYAYEPVTEAEMRAGKAPMLTRLARLMPWETTISRRKYRFLGGDSVPAVVRVFGTRRFRPLAEPEEVLPIQDLDAVRQFVMRLENEREGELGQAAYHQAQAQRDLNKGLRQHNGAAGEGSPLQFVNDGSAGFGDLRNL